MGACVIPSGAEASSVIHQLPLGHRSGLEECVCTKVPVPFLKKYQLLPSVRVSLIPLNITSKYACKKTVYGV